MFSLNPGSRRMWPSSAYTGFSLIHTRLSFEFAAGRLLWKMPYGPRTAIWDGSGTSFARLSSGLVPPGDFHPELDSLNGFTPSMPGFLLVRLRNLPEWCIFVYAFPGCSPVWGGSTSFETILEEWQLSQNSKAPALQAQSPRTARGQIRIMGYHDRSEPM